MVSNDNLLNVFNIVYNIAGYDERKAVSSFEIMEQTNLGRKNLYDILVQLKARHLIKEVNLVPLLGGGTVYIYITSTGLLSRENS